MFYFRLALLHLLLRIILPHCALNIVLVRHLKMTKIAVLLKCRWRWRSTEVKVSVHSCRLKLLLLLIHPSEQKMQVKTNSQSK